MKIGLKAGERLFLNGAVIRVERKTSIELLNDAVFLLESHIIQRDEATTPLRQLYFVLQSMVMTPSSADMLQKMAEVLLKTIRMSHSDDDLHDGLEDIAKLLSEERWFEAMKVTRGLYPLEESAGKSVQSRKNVMASEPFLEAV